MQEVAIETLKPGSRFGIQFFTIGRVIHGTLLSLGPGSAFVEWDAAPRNVSFISRKDGEEHKFETTAKRREHICKQTPVFQC